MANEKPFLDVFAQCNEAVATMDYSGSGWLPPEDTTYTVKVSGTKGSRFTSDGIEKLRYAVQFEIVDGEYTGRKIVDKMFIPIGGSELSPGLRTLCYLATCLAGREIMKADEAYEPLSHHCND